MIDSPLLAIVVFAAICAAPLLLRRYRGSTPNGVRVVGRSAISKQAVVAVVVVDGRRLLVGAGDKGVDLIAELAPEEAEQHDTVTSPVTATGAVGAGAPATGRTDAAGGARPPIDADRLSAAVGGRGPTMPGPGTGLLDRLRAMTVRTTPPGRPSHAVHRR